MLIFKPIVVSMKNLVTKTVNSMTMKFYMSFFLKALGWKKRIGMGIYYILPTPRLRLMKKKLIPRILLGSKDPGTIIAVAAT